MDLRKKYQDACEKLGWDVTDEGYGIIRVSQYSPEEEAFSIAVSADNFVKDVRDQYEGFDVDEHVEMWLEARRNGVRDVPTSIRALVEDAEAIDSMLEKLADTLEGVERERVDIKLTAHTNPAVDIRLEGATLELADGREVYADFVRCDTERSSIDWELCNAEYQVRDVTFRDEKGGEEILLEADELRYAELKAVHVRCDREEGLYFEAESVDITAWDADSRKVQLMHDNSNSTLGHVDVHAADHGGNDWHVADHKTERKPGLDDLIRGAEDRAAAEGSGRERSTPEMEH